ncbi:hypothetical protein JYG23_14165 [Sedimentibacter sp. zth1]|uniref:putative ABC transporter permease n=1 Tax=Sedimentibacter sp. zth1 TaxID=2816908 RepID=UPI001A91EA63|nr:hypothetical protein [Sedimentibacter sp. zth1]QSX05790.1 hypothetical protein JYG23_14165 [Sedimentibacter sp. zth1]
MQKILKYLFLFLVGGTVYYLIEVTVRGFSHPSMFICGGICFICVGSLNLIKGKNIGLIKQMILGSVIITVLEFITGYIVNIILKLNVWDYSSRLYNLLGQICLRYSIVWFFLSIVAIFFDDFLRHKFFHEPYPNYKLF